MLTYPHINPIAISIGPVFGLGPLRVHWYGLMYLIGFVVAWWLARYRAKQPGSTWTPLDIEDLIFHGGMAGVLVAGAIFAKVKHKQIPDVFDFLAPLPGIGLLAGRLGNFINGELWGQPTDLPWGFGVPNADGVLISRHSLN